MKKTVRLPLIIFFSFILLYSGCHIYTVLMEYGQSDSVKIDTIRVAMTIQAPGTASTTPRSSMPAASPTDTVEKIDIAVDFDALSAINPDIVGWLYCEGTPVNYPVVQGSDNVYYLDHLYSGEKNRSGTLFLDCRCSPYFSDNNSIIYGHHMKNGGMFACITQYRSQEYYDAHPAIYLLTPSGDYILKVFSGYITDPDTNSFEHRFETEADYAKMLAAAVEESDFQSRVAPATQDKVVTLSTCTYEYENARYVVHAVLTRISPEV